LQILFRLNDSKFHKCSVTSIAPKKKRKELPQIHNPQGKLAERARDSATHKATRGTLWSKSSRDLLLPNDLYSELKGGTDAMLPSAIDTGITQL
jgi:hypothetical protein